MKPQLFVIAFFLIMNLTTLSFGQTAYITEPVTNSAYVLDLTTNTITDTITVSAVADAKPQGVAVSPDGTKVYFVNHYDNTVYVVNTVDNSISTIIPVGGNPTLIAVSPDGSKIYVACQSVIVYTIDAATNSISDSMMVGYNSRGIAVSPDGSKLYITDQGNGEVNVVSTLNNTVTANIPVGNVPYGICITPDGSKVYVLNSFSNTLSVINTTIDTVIASIPCLPYPKGICVTPDGSKLYVTHSYDSLVTVISTLTDTVVAQIPVVISSNGISVTPDGSLVCIQQYNCVRLINTLTDSVTSVIPVGTNLSEMGNFISSFSAPTSVTESSLMLNNEFNVFPNPSAGKFTLTAPLNIKEILITDITGKEILKTTCNQSTIDFHIYENGIYLVKFYTNEGVYNSKVIVNGRR